MLLLLTIIMVNISAYSQDKIVKKDGKTLRGDVQSEDDEKVYFSMYSSGKKIDTFISKTEVDTVIYKVVDPNVVKLDNASFGLGFGQIYGGIGMNVCVIPQQKLGHIWRIGPCVGGSWV